MSLVGTQTERHPPKLNIIQFTVALRQNMECILVLHFNICPYTLILNGISQFDWISCNPIEVEEEL